MVFIKEDSARGEAATILSIIMINITIDYDFYDYIPILHY